MVSKDYHRLNFIESKSDSLTIPKDFLLIQKQELIYIQLKKIQKIISKRSLMNTNKFIVKLTQMMREFPQIISWSEDGQEMEIFDIRKFQTQVHPKYFESTNYQSFLRQLNMYSFKKMSKKKNSVCFRHLIFRKGNEFQFQLIKRRERESKVQKSTPKAHNKGGQRRKIQDKINNSHATSLKKPIDQLPSSIREAIALIRYEMPSEGLYLVQRLQSLLLESTKEESLPRTQNASSMEPIESQKQCVSFYRLEEIMKNKHSLPNIQFQFEENVSQGSFYMEQ